MPSCCGDVSVWLEKTERTYRQTDSPAAPVLLCRRGPLPPVGLLVLQPPKRCSGHVTASFFYGGEATRT